MIAGDLNVTLSDPNDPRQGSTVAIYGPLSAVGVTDASGSVDPDFILPPGNYVGTASRAGYRSVTQAFNVAPSPTCADVHGFFLEKL